jgi:hypothetical protein
MNRMSSGSSGCKQAKNGLRAHWQQNYITSLRRNYLTVVFQRTNIAFRIAEQVYVKNQKKRRMA